ncbi:hypothetical protein RYA05_00100 [Pseudomonas syringae pv. actinidiae]|nr:hypothetical protein [Pseudomonas syringae pv. actinidiae]
MKLEYLYAGVILLFCNFALADNITGDLATHLSTIDQFEQKMRENRALLEANKIQAPDKQKPNNSEGATLAFKADGFLVTDRYYREGPYIKFCEAPYASTDGRTCAALDPVSKKVMKHLTYTSQEFLDATFGAGVTEFASVAWKDDGAIIYYRIVNKS